MVKELIYIKLLDKWDIFPFISIVKNILACMGLGLIFYAFTIFIIVSVSLLKVKEINTFKVVHILSVIDVYTFICLLIGIILSSCLYGIITLKIVLFSLVIIFNGITVTRLIAKTSYFYNMHSKNKS